jgi:hypothetical protein
MKKIIVPIWFVFSMGCTPYSYFSTSNDMLKMDCVVYLINGSVERGKLTIQLETGHAVDNIIRLLTINHEEIKIAIDSVKYYNYKNDFYYPKILNLEAYEIPNKNYLPLPNVRNILFLKALTKQNSRIMMYELYEPAAKTNDGADHHDYFVSFENDGRLNAWNLGNRKFFPNFEEKVADLVADCPELSDKIRRRLKAYYLGRISVDAKKYEVFQKIVSEYNACK